MASGTTYGATDGPGRPFMAAILGPKGLPVAINIATDGLGDPFWGDHWWHDRSHRTYVNRYNYSGPLQPCGV